MIEATSPYITEAKAGDLDVVGRGLIPTSNTHPLSLFIDDLTITFKFEVDPSIKGAYVDAAVDGKNLTWVLKNFDNTLGQGVLDPQKLGSAFKRELFMTFWIWTPSGPDEGRMISYVFYLGKEVDE